MILRSMPGIGRINLATLLCEGSGPLSRRDYPALRTLVRCCAGHQAQRQVTHRHHALRVARPVAQRGVSRLGPGVATQHDPKSRERYAALRRRGKSHGRALRGVADRLLGLA